MLPNFVIAGVNKAGTTSLFSYLSGHPDVCASSVKETCYFLPIRYNEIMTDLNGYEALFSHCSGQKIIMEATPGYFYGGKPLAVQMKATLGDAKVVLILREPVERLTSFFKFMKSRLMLPAEMTLEGYVEACMKQLPEMLKQRDNNPFFGLEGGCYIRYLPDWIEVFGNNLHVFFFDDLRDDPVALLKNIAIILEIDGQYFNGLSLNVENKTTGYENRALHNIALTINHSFEHFFRKYPSLKKNLRSIYYHINGKAAKEVIGDRAIAKIKSYYQPHNSELLEVLKLRTDSRLPLWLVNSA